MRHITVLLLFIAAYHDVYTAPSPNIGLLYQEELQLHLEEMLDRKFQYGNDTLEMKESGYKYE